MVAAKKFDPSQHLTNLKGKDYLEVKWRLVWFREEHPDASLDTEFHELTDQRCVMRAIIEVPGGGKATGVGSETPGDFKDYIEKAETKAIGRALAAMGYGTQFAPEIEEGDRIVDSPVQAHKAPQKATQTPAKAPANQAAMKRIDELLQGAGLSGVHLNAYAVQVAGHKSANELTTDELKRLADGLKTKTEVTVAYLTKLAGDLEMQQMNAEVNAKIDGGK